MCANCQNYAVLYPALIHLDKYHTASGRLTFDKIQAQITREHENVQYLGVDF